MVGDVDVVVENFRPGVMAKWGLDYAALSAEKSDLIYVSISGYGQSGTWRDRRAYAPYVHAEAGYLPPEGELDVFAQALRSVCEPIFGRPLREISFARLLAQLLQLTEAFSMPVQPQLLLLQNNMLMAEGISRRLPADLNIWSLAQPLVEDWVIENRGPQARLRDSAEEAAHSLSRLPETLRDVRKAAHNLAEGAVRLHPESIAALRQEQVGNRWQTRLLWGLVGLLVLLLLLD